MDNTTPLASTNDAATPLPELAQLITQSHRAADGSAREAVQHAITAGRLLLEVKGRLPHGDFQPWLKQNCADVTLRTAQRYMQIAKHWEKWDDQKRHAVSRLSLRNVLRSFPSDAKPGRASIAGGSDEEEETAYACPCGCGFEWGGADPKPPKSAHRLAELIGRLRRLRPEEIDRVEAFILSLSDELKEAA
jgi:hypothetical protein